jgi:SAM-dependent methyltransferase
MDIRQIALCGYKGGAVAKDAPILDFGCGAGQRVYDLLDNGYPNAYGFDIQDYLALRKPADRAHFAIAADGRIPFPDASFAFVFSDEVFEHVLDQETAFREIYRVLQPGGYSVHVIPAKWQVIERHIYVPFGGLGPCKRYSYYLFWAWLGIRNEFQRGLAPAEVARRNTEYARADLHYLSCRQYRHLFRGLPFQWSWEEVAYMQVSYKPRIQQLARASQRVPLLVRAIRTFWTRVLFLRKPT